MNNSDVIQLAEVLRRLAYYRWMFITCVGAASILGLLFSFIATKEYQSETLLMPADQDRRAPELPSELFSLGSLAGINLSVANAKKAEALAILESRQFVRDFIKKNELMPVLYSDEWDESAQSWNDDEPPTIYDAVTRFGSTVYRVRRVPNSDMIRLSVVWTNPSVAAMWVSRLVSQLNETLRIRAIDKAEKNISFLEQQLEETSNVELRQAIYRLIENQIHNKMLAHVQEEYAFVTIDPPVVADLDDYVTPRRALYIIGSGLVGLLLGFLLFFVLSSRQLQQ